MRALRAFEHIDATQEVTRSLYPVLGNTLHPVHIQRQLETIVSRTYLYCSCPTKTEYRDRVKDNKD